MRSHAGEYGVDGDYRVVPAYWQARILAVVGVLLAWVIVKEAVEGDVVEGTAAGVVTLLLASSLGLYLRTTLVGKFEVWAAVLADLRLRGDERLLDLGCGRGAVLLAAARLLPQGRVVGVDLWRADQTGNTPNVTRRNAQLEGVAERVDLVTGDMRGLPFEDGVYDVVVSSLAIHNIPSPAGRLAAIDEAVRVLRPGGRLVVADPLWTGRYTARLRELGLVDVRRRSAGWRMWWGGPWLPTGLATATKRP
ncbi:class I SAM-dependent methyltransferase [Actinomadura harenae]|uniref:Class I SAM-dependent methyltransferase n=1 Tax=Actinomadura harenae TaxID=2483351 RepID=A0A3M2LUN5_9ACTN|nr:class I SAM-dependent methyltransferase [Actinomadura harenae]